MKRALLNFALLLPTIVAMAQTHITGTVTNTEGKSVPEVVVKVLAGTKNVSYCLTDAKGRYDLRFSHPAKALTLQFTHLAYEKEEQAIENKNGVHNMTLLAKNITLREVKIKANPLKVAGDTLRYTLAPFLTKGDVSLEDGLKRLPGIKVTADGTVNYMGQSISNFYIEGMDMLEGRYNLATRNLPAKYATQVEVLRHHRNRKVDNDVPSDKVALNIKLSNKAKFKPFGQWQGGTGWQEKSPLYALAATGMMFTDSFQTILSGKMSNYHSFASSDLIDHFEASERSTLATSLLGGFETGSPPQGEYLYSRNAMTSLNTIEKLPKDATLRANADYSYSRNDYSSHTTSTYFANGEGITVDESTSPLTMVHRPSASIVYTRNSVDRWLSNNIKLTGQFEKNLGDILRGSDRIAQERKASAFIMSNDLNMQRNNDGKKWGFKSHTEFKRTPSLRMTFFEGAEGSSAISQTGQSTEFGTTASSFFSVKLSKKIRLEIPVQLTANYCYLQTLLHADTLQATNRLHGWRLEPKASPNISFETDDKKLYVAAKSGFSLLSLTYHSAAKASAIRLDKCYMNPSMEVNYYFDANNEINLESSYIHNVGDMASLVTSPVQRTYRTTCASSGVIGTAADWNTTLHYKITFPMQFLNMGARASYNKGKRNVLNTQQVEGTNVATSSLSKNSHNQSASFDVDASQNITSLLSKIFLDAGYTWGSSQMMNQNRPTTTYGTRYKARAEVTCSPLQWLEMAYNIRFTKSHTHYSGQHNSVTSLSHNGTLSVYPTQQLRLSFRYDHTRQQLASKRYKNMSLFDASAQYKTKKVVWKLELNNLLNTRHYAYTIFDNVNTYSYDYNLCGRTLMLSAQFNI